MDRVKKGRFYNVASYMKGDKNEKQKTTKYSMQK